MMTESVSVSFLWVLSPRRSLIFQHLGNAINHKHQEVPYKGKREKMGRNPPKPLHLKGALLQFEEHYVALVLTAGWAPALLADIKRWRESTSRIFSLVSMLSIFL